MTKSNPEPTYPFAIWQREVANDETDLGYDDWLALRLALPKQVLTTSEGLTIEIERSTITALKVIVPDEVDWDEAQELIADFGVIYGMEDADDGDSWYVLMDPKDVQAVIEGEPVNDALEQFFLAISEQLDGIQQVYFHRPRREGK